MGQGFSSTVFLFSSIKHHTKEPASFAALQAEECTRMRRDSCYCHERVSKTDTEEKKLFNKLFIFVFFADKKSILVATKHYGWTTEMSHGLF